MTDPNVVRRVLRSQRIETPSWAYGNSGTRFKVFGQEGVARDPYEKIADAAEVHCFTGVAPSVALHIPWDSVERYDDLAKDVAEVGLQIGAINPSMFQEDEYRLGSVCHPDPGVGRKVGGVRGWPGLQVARSK
jgi:L-rhamnose isomerase/sugar isomerase